VSVGDVTSGGAVDMSISVVTTDLDATYLPATDMASNVTGDSIDMRDYRALTACTTWEGAATPIGAIAWQGSLDDSTWHTIDGAGHTVDGVAGDHMFEFDSLAISYVRFKYTATSGGSGDDVAIMVIRKRF